jgi:hypothetical protein
MQWRKRKISISHRFVYNLKNDLNPDLDFVSFSPKKQQKLYRDENESI